MKYRTLLGLVTVAAFYSAFLPINQELRGGKCNNCEESDTVTGCNKGRAPAQGTDCDTSTDGGTTDCPGTKGHGCIAQDHAVANGCGYANPVECADGLNWTCNPTGVTATSGIWGSHGGAVCGNRSTCTSPGPN